VNHNKDIQGAIVSVLVEFSDSEGKESLKRALREGIIPKERKLYEHPNRGGNGAVESVFLYASEEALVDAHDEFTDYSVKKSGYSLKSEYKNTGRDPRVSGPNPLYTMVQEAIVRIEKRLADEAMGGVSRRWLLKRLPALVTAIAYAPQMLFARDKESKQKIIFFGQSHINLISLLLEKLSKLLIIRQLMTQRVLPKY